MFGYMKMVTTIERVTMKANASVIKRLRDNGFSRRQAEIIENAIRTNRIRHAGIQMNGGFNVHWDMIECPNGNLVSITILQG